MDPTQTHTTEPPSDAVVRGQQIYDDIMREIEPELMSASLPLLTEKYKNETPEEAKVRGEKYDAAFAEYDRRYAAYMANMGGSVRSLQRTVRAGIENDEHTEEETSALQNLESSLSTL